MDRYGFRPVFIRVKCDRCVRGCNHHAAFPSPVALRDWHGVCPQQLDEGVNTFVSRAMAVQLIFKNEQKNTCLFLVCLLHNR